MGEPKDAEFERGARRMVHERYKKNAAATRKLMNLLTQAKARIEYLEFQLAQQAEIVELAERIISDGTVNDGSVEMAGVDQETPG